MKEILTPIQWAEHLNKYVKHTLFGEVLLVGLRTRREENRNLMLNIKTEHEYFWVYDYETERIEYTPNLYL
jgi:hypothetical protein